MNYTEQTLQFEMGDNTLGQGKSAIVYETDLRGSEWVDKKWGNNSRKMKQ